MQQSDSNLKIYQAPLQGLTDYVFRNAIDQIFGGIDQFFTPYLVFENDGKIKPSRMREVLPKNNAVDNITPQILVKDSQEASKMIELIKQLEYNSVNLNLGCPYPMVTNRGRGAGLLPFPERVRSILETMFSEFNGTISIKLRCGLTSSVEQQEVLNVLNDFSLQYIFLHPRIGKQLYKGSPSIDDFIRAQELSNHKLIYNGDINSVSDFMRLQQTTGKQSEIMLGRGLLYSPVLALNLKGATVENIEQKMSDFHNEIFEKVNANLSGSSHILQKMRPFWEYFSHQFNDQHKTFKRIKKAKNIASYHEAVEKAFFEGVKKAVN